MPPAEWERVRADLAAHFSPADVERLAYARARGLPVTIDLERRRLLVPEGQAAWDLPPGKLMEEQP